MQEDKPNDGIQDNEQEAEADVLLVSISLCCAFWGMKKFKRWLQLDLMRRDFR